MRTLTRREAILLGVLAASLSRAAEPDMPARALMTPAVALDTMRVMRNAATVDEANPDGVVSISPDGQRYVLRLVRGNVTRNRVELRILTGELSSVTAAVACREVARLFTSGLGAGVTVYPGPHQDTSAGASDLRWLDRDRIAFLWSDEANRRQVVSVHLMTGETAWLTEHPQSVVGFDTAESVVVYNAVAPPPSTATPDEEGFVIDEHTDALSLLLGERSGNLTDRRMNTQWFTRKGNAAPEVIEVTRRAYDLDVRHEMVVSADGRWALVDATPDEVPGHWARYTAPSVRRWVTSALQDRMSGFGRTLHQWYVVDLEMRRSRPLWDAPTVGTRSRAAWSPDHRHVVVAPSVTPLEKSASPDQTALVVAVVEVSTGRYQLLPVQLDAHGSIELLRFVGASTIEIGQRIDGVVRRERFQRRGEGWQHVSERRRQPAVRVRVQEDLNTPPRVIAEDTRAHRQQLILDLNPGLNERLMLGRVVAIEGKLREGQRWSGLLFYPVHYAPTRRYPLVIQSVYGAPPTREFTLYGTQGGAGLGPPMIAPYAGQSFAARDMVVLHLNVQVDAQANTPAEAELRQEAFESAANDLVRAGLVDPQRVGLLGFSRNGYYVEFALTHSTFPFAVALVDDHWDTSYVAQILTGGIDGALAVNGGTPFGGGLASWLRRAPGFNADRVHAPLRIVEQSHGGYAGVILKWELFSQLRRLRKPVEFYVMPKSAQGAHNTQNPAQILAVQESTVDWFDFWLNDREDPALTKRQQYQRWRRLRDLDAEHRSARDEPAALH